MMYLELAFFVYLLIGAALGFIGFLRYVPQEAPCCDWLFTALLFSIITSICWTFLLPDPEFREDLVKGLNRVFKP